MQIQPNERDKIAVWLGQGISQRTIAKRLKRSVSSISAEVARNSFHGYYVAIHAQRVAEHRKSQAGKRPALKSERVYAYVLDKLRCGWSPEQIAGRLRKETGAKTISYETIYRYIYHPETKNKRLWEYLPLKRKRRLTKYGRKSQRIRIPNQVTIHLRPKSVEARKSFGHWEADSLIGKQEGSRIIHTEVERKTRYLAARVVNSKSAVETIKSQVQIFSRLPAKSVTMDNGLEFVNHEVLNHLGIKTYFADPYASWQRGTNENTNGLLRRYLPKRTSFVNLDQDELNDIVEEINNRPRKILNFSTPQEMLELELNIKKCSDSI